LNPLRAYAQQCLPAIEEIAESYCMEKFDHSQRIALEEHYLACERCRSIVANTDQFIRAMKIAAQRLASSYSQT
jgi:hypothetical protein